MDIEKMKSYYISAEWENVESTMEDKENRKNKERQVLEVNLYFRNC
jgi:hypothetical protein